MHTLARNILRSGALLLAVAAMLVIGTLGASAAPTRSPAAAPPTATLPGTTCPLILGTQTCTLYATTGTLALPAGSVPASVAIWGYSTSATPGTATLPGPTLIVDDSAPVDVILNNVDLPIAATSLAFPGQNKAPDTSGVGAGGSTTYSFAVADLKPGTYLYEAGLTADGQVQVAMGLFGALIVRPSALPASAYGTPDSAFDDEALVVLSEIDPAFNAAPTTFDMGDYAPKYWLINGEAYPDTDPISVGAGNRALLRYVNAGLDHHSMGLLGLRQTILAGSGQPLPFTYRAVAETIAAGATLDAITTIPATAAAGTQYALRNAGGHLDNASALTAGQVSFGGMLTFLTVGAGGPPVVGPTTSNVTMLPNPTNGSVAVTLSASIGASGGPTVTGAEYFVDTLGGNGAGCPITIGLGAPPASVSRLIPTSGGVAPCVDLATLSSGNHTFYVHGQDANGWGAVAAAVLNLDKAGPPTSSISITPNPTNGSVSVALQATGSDIATGGANVNAAEYFVDPVGTPAGGSGTPMALNNGGATPTASLNATILATTVSALSQGNHAVSIRSRDAFGNWGALASITLKVDQTGPNASSLSVIPNPNNGTLSYNINKFALKLSAMLSDPIVGGINSNIVAAEGFIDTVGADGTGYVFTANDGTFNSPSEGVYVEIPLSALNGLANGPHNLYVHGRDAAGNWGLAGSTILLIDRTPPTFSSISLAPNPTSGAANVTLTVNGAVDTGGAGVAGGEYWFGTTNPAPGGGTAFTGLTANIPVGSFALGTYTVRARIRDAAGNWGAGVNGATLTVSPPPLYFSTAGNTNPPGVGGTADDADIYFYNGTAFSRAIDVTAIVNPLPGGANVDGFDRVDATHFYMSFNGTVTIALPGPDLTVQDEDVVFYNAGAWSVYFDGTPAATRGLGGSDLDAISIVGGTLYFSTDDNDVPVGVVGGGDDADIYSWNGVSFSRVFDASANGLPGGADVDGFVRVDATHFYLSFNTDTVVPVLGAVQDEDVVYYNAGAWSVYFDGTALGLTAANQDLDAFDLP